MSHDPSDTGVPVVRSRKRGCMVWIRGVLLVTLIVVVALVITGVTWQAVAAQADTRDYPPPGQLVDVGGHRLQIHCLGEGTPTVILEAGAGEFSPMWGRIQTQLALTMRVCAYDRAGFGWSDSGPQPRDGQQIVTELHLLLSNAHIEPPYILVGHSFGGGLVRLYNQQYPAEAAGIVLVDSRHPDQLQRIPEQREELEYLHLLTRAGELTAPFGLMRLYWGDAGPNPDLPVVQSAQMKAFFATARPYRAQLDEALALDETDAQVRAAGDLGDLPLLVLSQDTTGMWMTFQEELAGLSSDGQWQVIDGATHIGLLTDERQAAETSAAIRQFITVWHG